MKNNLITKFFISVALIILLSGCETTKSMQDDNSNLIQNLNQANDLGIDFMCYNMSKDSTKGMSLNQLDKFCKLQCPLK